MIAYLDTNIAIWLALGKARQLTRAAERIVREADRLLSPMVVLELEDLYDLRRSRLRSRDVQAKLAFELGVTRCEFSFAEIAELALDESWTRDLFDRLIVANAKANGLAFLISAEKSSRNTTPRLSGKETEVHL